MTDQAPPPPDPNIPPVEAPTPPVDYASGPAASANSYVGPAPDKDACMWGMLCHLGALVGLLGIPFGHLLGPLVFWLIKKNEYPFVDDQGKEAVNFQITVTFALIASALLICVGIGIVMMILVGLAAMIFAIIAGVKANSGIAYRYPWTLRLIK